MSQRVSFCIVLHNHQPVGNLDEVMRSAYRQCYAPFLDTLAKYPDIRVSLHISGALFDWLESNEPAYIDRLARFVSDERVELLGGGYFEPVLAVIPRRDAIAQFEMTNEYLEKRFGARPAGAWLYERIWDAQFPDLLESLGIKYTVLDETHFRAAGIGADGMMGHYLCERLGKAVHVFPIRKDLRYAIPFAEPGKTIEILRSIAAHSPGACATYADDGEKFGVWPETHDWVYNRGWLDRFFRELSSNGDWLATTTLGAALSRTDVLGRVYLPSMSYPEMTEWAMPPDGGFQLANIRNEFRDRSKWPEYEAFIRGGLWDNFLAKYPESNRLHKRMLYVSDKVSRCPAESTHTALARRELLKAQSGCAYWHGLFGGIYLGFLRDTVTRHLARAENYADLLLYGGAASVRAEVFDFDVDGHDEILLESPRFKAVVHPRDGGCVSELVLAREEHSLANVISRRREIYHERARQQTTSDLRRDGNYVADENEIPLDSYLVYDRYTRACFRDRFFESTPPLETMMNERTHEIGRFANLAGEMVVDEGKAAAVCDGMTNLTTRDGERTIHLHKSIAVYRDEPMLLAEYTFENRSDTTAAFVWSCELNVTLGDPGARERHVDLDGARHPLDAEFEEPAERLALIDATRRFRLLVHEGGPALVRQYPIRTISQSEAGFELLYQGTCIAALREITLAPGASASFRIPIGLAPLS